MTQRMLARKPATASAEPQFASSSLRINKLGDTFEQEADRIADTVMSGGRVPSWSIAKVGMGGGTGTVQRDTPDGSNQQQQAPKPNNYGDAAKKAAEAFMKTDAGKKLLQAVESDPLVKSAKDLATTLPGIVIIGTAATGAVAALAAEHKALPMQVPAIPLDFISPKLKGIKLNLTWEGPVDKPTKATIGFSGTFGGGGSDKKKKDDTSERIAREKQALQASMDMFKPKDKGASDDVGELLKEGRGIATPGFGMEDFGSSRRSPAPLPGTQGAPLAPLQQPSAQQPAPGLQAPGLGVPWRPKTLQLLDKQLELKPLDKVPEASAGKDQQEKKEEVPVQRKADPSAPMMQRKCSCGGDAGTGGTCEECNAKEGLQRKASGAAEMDSAPASVHGVLRSSGTPLDRATRSFFEPRFGHDFSKVRIHSDSQAAASAGAVNALAYTVGNDVVFASGRYSPSSSEGRKLLAHELAHTIQQSRLSPGTPSHDALRLGVSGDAFEAKAEAAARDTTGSAALGDDEKPALDLISQPTLQRVDDPYAKLTIEQLRRKAAADPGAAEALRLRYREMPTSRLQQFKDPMAQSVLSQRNIQPADAEGHGPFSNPAIRNALEKDIQQERAASGITRRSSSAVDPNVEPEGGTIGSARTDIPGLEDRAFLGRSPRAGGQVNPGSNFPPATDPATLPHTHGHAEQAIADELEAALKDIPRDLLKGRRVSMLIEQEPCSTCAQGASNPEVATGVLKKLSQKFPDVTFEIKNLDSNAIMVLKNGATPATSPVGASGTGSGTAATGAGATPLASEGQGSPTVAGESVAPGAVKSPTSEGAAGELQAGAESAGEIPKVGVPETPGSVPIEEVGAAGGAAEISVAGIAVGIIIELAIGLAIGLILNWIKGKIEQAFLDRDIRRLSPAIAARLKQKEQTIRELQTKGKVYASITFDIMRRVGSASPPEAMGNIATWDNYSGVTLAQVEVSNENKGNSQSEQEKPGLTTIYSSETEVHNLQTVSQLLDDPEKRRRERENAAAKEKLRRDAAKHPAAPPPSSPQEQTPLLPTLAPRQTGENFQPLPGWSGPSPVAEAQKVVSNFKQKAQELIARGNRMLADSPSEGEINAFKHDEEIWRAAATVVNNHFTDHGPDVGASGMDEALKSDQYGGRLREIRSQFGG